MRRLMVQLPDDLFEDLRAHAAADGVSAAEIVRRALRAYIPDDRWERALSIAGRYASGTGDVAEHHDRYLEEAYAE